MNAAFNFSVYHSAEMKDTPHERNKKHVVDEFPDSHSLREKKDGKNFLQYRKKLRRIERGKYRNDFENY